jgi:hypothetical protein
MGALHSCYYSWDDDPALGNISVVVVLRFDTVGGIHLDLPGFFAGAKECLARSAGSGSSSPPAWRRVARA